MLNDLHAGDELQSTFFPFIFHIVDLKVISQDEGQQNTKRQKVNIINMLGDDLIVIIGTMVIREKIVRFSY